MRAVEQRLGVGKAADAKDAVVEGLAALGAPVVHLVKRRARIGLGGHAQVEVGVEVDHQQAAGVGAGLHDALERAPGHFVTTAEPQRQAAARQGPGHALAQLRLGGFERVAFTSHIARVPQRGFAQHRQVGQRTAQRLWAEGGTGAPGVAAHAFVHGKADQRDASLAVCVGGPHVLVPAGADAGFFGVDTAAPFKGCVRIHVRSSPAATTRRQGLRPNQ